MTTTATTRVFVYGTLLSGFGNHRLLRGRATPCGSARTRDAYTMIDLGAFPAVLSRCLPRYAAPVRGEVYECDADVLADLDRLEGYHGDASGLYDRITVDLDDGTTALMYVMHGAPRWRSGAAIIDESDWRTWTTTDDAPADDDCSLEWGGDYCDCGRGCVLAREA